MNAISAAARTESDLRHRQPPVLGWLRVRPRLVFGGLAVVLLVAASTFGRPWLEALGVGSAVLSLLPCAAMCAAGLCMGRGSGGCAQQGSNGAEARSEAPSAPTPDNHMLTS